MTFSYKCYVDHSNIMYSSGNIDVRNWVHLFESRCILQLFCITSGVKGTSSMNIRTTGQAPYTNQPTKVINGFPKMPKHAVSNKHYNNSNNNNNIIAILLRPTVCTSRLLVPTSQTGRHRGRTCFFSPFWRLESWNWLLDPFVHGATLYTKTFLHNFTQTWFSLLTIS